MQTMFIISTLGTYLLILRIADCGNLQTEAQNTITESSVESISGTPSPIRDKIAKKEQKNRTHLTNCENLLTVDQTYDVEEAKKRLPDNIVCNLESHEFSLAEQNLQKGTPDTYRYIVKKIYDHPIANFELLVSFAKAVQDPDQKLKLYDALYQEMKTSGQYDTQKLIQLGQGIKAQLLNHTNDETATMARSLLDRIIYNELTGHLQSHEFGLAEQKLMGCTDDAYAFVVSEIYRQQMDNFELMIRFIESIRNEELVFKLYNSLHNEMMNSDQQIAWRLNLLRKSIKKKMFDQKAANAITVQALYNAVQSELVNTSVGLICDAFQNDTSWPMAKQLSADIDHDDCNKCTIKLYKEVVECIWNKITILDIVQNARNNLLYISEEMVIHKAIINKLKQTGTLTANLAMPLARYMKQLIDMSNYKNYAQVDQTNYEEVYNMVKRTIQEAAVEPIAAAFQNNTLWPMARNLSAEIDDNCSQCTVDIYKKVIETVWNKVSIPDLLQKSRDRLKYIDEDMAVHTAIINKLNHTGNLNDSLTLTITYFMMKTMDMSKYPNVAQMRRTNYEALYDTMKITIREAAVGFISFAFQEDTSWPMIWNLSTVLHDNCSQCTIDIYNKVIESIWNKVSIPDLLKRTRDNLKYIEEDMAVHTAIINKLNNTGNLTTSLAAALAHYMKKEMIMSKYPTMAQVQRTNYEALYETLKKTIQEAAVGPISTAFQNDTSWSIVKKLSSDIYNICNQCTTDIYSNVIETIWDKVSIPDLLQRAQDNLKYIGEDIAVHTAVINKLNNTGNLTTSLAIVLAKSMKYETDLAGYQNVPQVERNDYKALYETMKTTIREAAVELISLAFQNNTSWSMINDLNTVLHDDCYQCTTNIYNKVIETVWNKVSIPDLLKRAQDNLEYIEEDMAVHTAIINKLNQTGKLTISLASALAHSMKNEMEMPLYPTIAQVRRTDYEALYNSTKITIQEAAVGHISTAFQNDTSWHMVKELSAVIHDNCEHCTVDIYNKVIDTIWDTVTVPDILQKTRNNIKYIAEEMSIHKTIFNKLKQTDAFTASSAMPLKQCMKEVMEMTGYKTKHKVLRSEYETLYETVENLLHFL